MAAPNKKTLAGSIHRIREFELEKVNLAEEFDILQIVGEGWFGKILLVEHRGTDTEMVLKALPKPYVPLRDFYREFHYGLHLGAHKNIITTYDIAFETAGFYVFSQEYAPLGDLTSNVSDTGIGELHTKRVAKQLAAALEHVHARDLVHRDVKLDNILIFKSDFSRIKLCDFGETRKSQTLIRRRNEWLPYAPPEVLRTPVEDTYKTNTSHDVWQFGIVIFVCLTGCLPWQKAAMDDPRYVRYLNWYNSSNPLKKQPKLFKLVSARAQKFFKKFLEPRPDKRPATVGDFQKYLDDRWMAKGINDKNGNVGSEIDELCPSMYSFHSDINEKNKLLHMFYEAGIETTVDRVAKKERIRQWIQNSVIAEEDEMENDSSNMNSIYNSEDEQECIRVTRHPIEQNHQRWSSMRYNDEKHINPRTGEVLQQHQQQQQQQQQAPQSLQPLPMDSVGSSSYELQNIHPLIPPEAIVRPRNGKDGGSNKVDGESPARQGSMTKDSAYGSIDLVSRDYDKKAFPSQKLQNALRQQAAGHHSMGSLNTAPADGRTSSSVNNLQRPSTSRQQQQQKVPEQQRQPQIFTPMKDNAYGRAPVVDTTSEVVVQGQMKIYPYGQQQARYQAEADVSMNGAEADAGVPVNNIDSLLSESEIDSLKQIKRMLIETIGSQD